MKKAKDITLLVRTDCKVKINNKAKLNCISLRYNKKEKIDRPNPGIL